MSNEHIWWRKMDKSRSDMQQNVDSMNDKEHITTAAQLRRGAAEARIQEEERGIAELQRQKADEDRPWAIREIDEEVVARQNTIEFQRKRLADQHYLLTGED